MRSFDLPACDLSAISAPGVLHFPGGPERAKKWPPLGVAAAVVAKRSNLAPIGGHAVIIIDPATVGPVGPVRHITRRIAQRLRKPALIEIDDEPALARIVVEHPPGQLSNYKPLLPPPPISPITTASEEKKNNDDNKNEIHIFLQTSGRKFPSREYGCRITIRLASEFTYYFNTPAEIQTGAVKRSRPISVSLPTTMPPTSHADRPNPGLLSDCINRRTSCPRRQVSRVGWLY